MFKRLYAIGAHEDFFSPPHAPYQIFTAVWYDEYQGVVQAVPHRGIESTTPWYREYHAVVFQPIAIASSCLRTLRQKIISRLFLAMRQKTINFVANVATLSSL